MFQVIIVLSHKDNARENYAIRERIRVVVSVIIVVVCIVGAVARGPAADVGSEENCGEEDEETKCYGYGITQTEIGEVSG